MRKLQWLIISGLLLFNACSDTLEVDNYTILEESKNYKTQAELSSNMLGIYSLMQEIVDDLVVLNDLRSNQLETTLSASLDQRNIEKLVYAEDNEYCNSRKYYLIINACNDFMVKAQEYLKDNSKADVDVINSHIADAIKIRSFIYFNIGKLYGSAYYFDKPINNDLDLEKLALLEKVSLDELIVQLISDIEHSDVEMFEELDWEAVLKVPANFAFYNYDTNVLLGDLYLWSKDYEMAVEYFKAAINDEEEPLPLRNNIYDDFNYSQIFSKPITATGDEVITALEFDEINQQIFELKKLFGVGGSDYQLRPTEELISLFRNETSKFIVNEGDIYRGVNCSYSSGVNPRVTKHGKSSIPRFIFYRVSEIHLKLCEALTMIDEFDIAYILLNDGVAPDSDPLRYWRGSWGIFKPPFDSSWDIEMRYNQGIRERVSLDNLEFPEGAEDWTNEQKREQMLEWIFNESNLELCFEGKRYETALRFARRYGEFEKYGEALTAENKNSYVAKLSQENGWYISW